LPLVAPGGTTDLITSEVLIAILECRGMNSPLKKEPMKLLGVTPPSAMNLNSKIEFLISRAFQS
jgi:hypothetical protein